jgi:hypothetical protein
VLFTNHVLSGALIGYGVGSPTLAFALGLASHLGLDAVPHWGRRQLSEIMPVAVTDGLLGAATSAGVALTAPRRRRAAVLAGMAGAALLDMDKPCTVFFGRSPFPRAVDRLHARIQRESPHRMPQELAVGIAAALVVSVAALRSHRRDRAESVMTGSGAAR